MLRKWKILFVLFIFLNGVTVLKHSDKIFAKITKSKFSEYYDAESSSKINYQKKSSNKSLSSKKKYTYKKKYYKKKYYKKKSYKKKYKTKKYLKKIKKKKKKSSVETSNNSNNSFSNTTSNTSKKDLPQTSEKSNTLNKTDEIEKIPGESKKAILKGEAGIVEYSGKNIPGLNSDENLTIQKDSLNSNNSTELNTSDASLTPKSENQNSLKLKEKKNFKAKNKSKKSISSSLTDGDDEPFKYKRHILISLLILLFAIFRFRRDARSSYSGK